MEDKVGRVKKQISANSKVIIGFAIVFFMTYIVVRALETADGNDYIPHIRWAMEIKWDELWTFFRNTISYPLWHFGIKILADLKVNANQAAALLTALFNAGAYIAVIWVWKKIGKLDINKEKSWFWAICLMVVNPLYAPWVNRHYYLGQAAPNIWHNPTNLAVKIFVVIGFGLILLLINADKGHRNWRTYALLSFVLVLSALAKPSFLQAIIPALGVFILIRILLDKSKFQFGFYLKLCATFIPSVVILIVQLAATFFNQEFVRAESHIRIGFGKVLHHWTPNLLISFILAFSFPLFVFLWDFKKLICKKEMQLLVCYEGVAWLESVLLYEDGEAMLQANFTWANLLSAFVVWMMMLGYYIHILHCDNKEERDKKKGLIVGGGILLVLHLFCGLAYWCYLCMGRAMC